VLSPRSSGPSACRRTPRRKGQTSAAHPFEHHGSAAQFRVAAQAVEGLVSPPTVAKPHKGSAPSTGPTGGLVAPCAAIPRPVPATVAARAPLALVPEASHQHRLGNRVDRNVSFLVYTRYGDQGRLLSLVLALRVWHHPGGLSMSYPIIGNFEAIYKYFIRNLQAMCAQGSIRCVVKSSYEVTPCI
jgi:hypothetical protein